MMLSVISVVTFIASEVMGIYVYQLGRRTMISRLFFFSFQCLAVWSLGLLFIYQSRDQAGFWLGDKASAIGWISFIALFLHMSLILTENMHCINKRWKVGLLYLPALILLIWEMFFLGPNVGREAVDAFYTAYDSYYISYCIVAFFCLATWGYQSDSKRKRTQAAIVSAAVLFTAVAAFCMERFFPLIIADEGRADPLHAFVFIMFAGFWYAINRYNLFSLAALIKPEDILDRITELVIVVDPSDTILMVNPSFEALTGYASEEAVGAKCTRFLAHASGEGCWLASDDSKMEAVIHAKHGETIPLQIRTSTICDQVGDRVGVLVMGQDLRLVNQLKHEIEIRKHKEKELEYNSFHDSLTGMYNRAYFELQLRQLDTQDQFPVGIIIADIDGLKFANDTFGHSEGDKLLLAAARILQDTVKNKGIVARTGGDEFVILITKLELEWIGQIEEDLRMALKDYNDCLPKVPLSISIGCAASQTSQERIVDLCKTADNNMYRVKLSQGQSARNCMVQALMHTLRARHVETEDHAERLRDLAIKLGSRIGLSRYELTELGLLAQFHDLGKVGIPDRILMKPGPLDSEEWLEMKRHPEIGHRISGSVAELMPIAKLILLHHERWDGQGYPWGIAGEQIPLECRILAIVDAYDAMTNARPYRAAMHHEQALNEISRCVGTQFDPFVANAFVEMMCTPDTAKIVQ
jgi:diguanylate cyclase (GGDEF)-like protein/PAS domain S-box-containing protein